MDLVTVIKEFGLPVGAAIALGWWLRASLTERIVALEARCTASDSKVDGLNLYIRQDLARISIESHQRERALVELLKQDFQPSPQLSPPPPPEGGTTKAENRPKSTETVRAALYKDKDKKP